MEGKGRRLDAERASRLRIQPAIGADMMCALESLKRAHERIAVPAVDRASVHVQISQFSLRPAIETIDGLCLRLC